MDQRYGSQEEVFQENITDTLKRQALSIGTKVKYTILMIPGDRAEAIAQLKNWDLWGPFFICFLFTLGIGIEANQKYVFDSFVNVFLIFWMGSFLVSINIRLLAKRGSTLQSISIIGYCMLPLALFGFIVSLLPSSTPAIVNVLLMIFGLLWSSVSCMIVMRDIVEESKKYLATYPIFLFYIFLSWYAIVA